MKFKDRLRKAGFSALALLALGSAAVAPAMAAEAEVKERLRLKAKSSIELKAGESTTRLGLNLGNLTSNMLISTERDSADKSKISDSVGHITYTNTVGEAPYTIWLRAKGDQRTVGADATVAGQYVAPLWLTFYDNGDFKSTGAFAIGSVGPVDYGFAGFAENRAGPNTDSDSHAEYLVLRRDDLAAGTVRDWDGNWRFDIGAGSKNFGAVADVKYIPEADEVKGLIIVAENPCGLIGAKGPTAIGKIFGLGEFPEQATYFKGTGNLSESGLAGRLDFHVKDGELTSIKPEIGYNTGSIAGSVGVNFGEDNTDATGKVSFRNGNVFVETSYTTDGTAKAYLSFTN